MSSQMLTISRLAASAGVNIETVRYYQRRGLLDEPPRPLRGIRHYVPSDVARLFFIRNLQKMGFTLAEIASLIEVNASNACEHTQHLINQKLVDVRQRLKELKQLECDLMEKARVCRQGSSSTHCPTLDSLNQGARPGSAHIAKKLKNAT